MAMHLTGRCRYFKNREMLYGSTFIWLLPHANGSSVAICNGLKSCVEVDAACNLVITPCRRRDYSFCDAEKGCSENLGCRESVTGMRR